MQDRKATTFSCLYKLYVVMDMSTIKESSFISKQQGISEKFHCKKMMLGEGGSSSKIMKIGEQKSPPKNQILCALVVDDDPMIRKIHSVILKSFGFKAEVAKNGKEAVDLFRAGAHFHMVIIDMEMPVMNGIEATKELRAMGVESKIVGVTSRGSETEKQTFIQAGVDVCYTKPLTMAMIISLMEDLKKK